MAVVVTAANGFDAAYPWKGQAQAEAQRDAESSKGGYYIGAAQAGEAPGRWFGKGAEALGFTPGQEVEREPYDKVYAQVDPRDGTKLGRAPGGYKKRDELLKELLKAEPHATAERIAELERQASQATRRSPVYTDATASISKSISIFHASIRENERQARLAGDEAAAAYWCGQNEKYERIVQDANRAGLEHLDRWAVTRAGTAGPRVDGQETIRYEDAGMVVTSWLQGTSRDGDMQDHIHNVIARMSLTASDGKWRALDTMALRAQLGAMRGIVATHLDAALTREFGVTMTAREDGAGYEIEGISRELIERYSTRTQAVKDETAKLAEAWTRSHGREPTRRELQYIQQEATMRSREGKEEGEIDWDALLESWSAKWDARDGSSLAQVASHVSNLRGPEGDADADGPREPEPGGPAPTRDAQAHAMQMALARVQAAHSSWTRADLMREVADCMPPEAHRMEPAAAVALLQDMTDRALAGEAEQVVCLDAPEWPPVPEHLRRELDGRSDYTRPGTSRYATQVQLSLEEQLVATAAREAAPHLTREQSAELLGAVPEALDVAGRERAQEATGQLPSGVSMGQAAALNAALTSPRNVYSVVGAAGTGKTHVLAQGARMWREAGMGPVIGLAVSQAARNVLAEAAQVDAYNLAQFLGHTEEARGVLGAIPLERGTLVLLDEATQVPMKDLADLLAYVEARGCKLVKAGDHGQLTAVESGGGSELIDRQLEYAQLVEAIRFTAEWEREASLRLRTGDTSVLTEYDQHGRICGGDADHIMDEARKAYLAGYLSGRDVLLMAQNHDTCRELSQRIREDLVHLGVVSDGPSAALRNGARASVGDLIITRKNDHGLGVANGDTWRVEAVDGDQITMRQMVDADRETGERRYADNTVTYNAGKTSADLAYAVDGHADRGRQADLAYAITGHSAQGRTVAEGIALITGTETREWAYVGMSRGRDGNYAYVATEPARVADPAQGVRPAPELERHERIERERAGQPEPEHHTQSELARDPIGVLSDVLENEGAEYSALEVQCRNLANADHLGKLHAIWDGETKDAVTGRYERLLREHLPEGYKDAELSGHATWLYRTLRGAEAAGLDADAVLAQAIADKPLTGVRDVAAVIDARIREKTGTLVPQEPGPWADRVPDIENPARREYVTAVAAAMDERTERLGEFTAEAAPVWAVRALGPVPDEPLDRLEWQDRVAKVASYREMHGYEDQGDAIGPEPVNSPEARAAWHAAFSVIGPGGRISLQDTADKRLLNMRASYEAETAWAPRYVADELKTARLAASEAARDATLADAQARAARDRGDEETAARHEAQAAATRARHEASRAAETQLAEAMQARKDWEMHTLGARHLALAAHSEYMRRHPDADLPPMRSAEPPRPAEEEHAEMVAATRGEHEPPQWLTELEEQNRATLAKIKEIEGLRVPNEDHEWEDLGEAWPDELRRERDAIIQPPKPEIRPAEPVAERAAEMASQTHDGDWEAGE